MYILGLFWLFLVTDANSSMTTNSVSPQQLFLTIQERIESGRYAPGAWLPTERTLAQEFSVDRSGIRSALAQLEEKGLITREPGRRPWVTQRGEKRKRASDPVPAVSSVQRSVVAILPQHPMHPASLFILHGLNTALRSGGAPPLRLQVFDTNGDSDSSAVDLEKQALDAVLDENVAGVVIWHMGGEDTLPQLRELQARGVPVVFIDRYPDGHYCDYVGVDNQASIEEAITHLRSLGHHRIAHLTTDEPTTAVIERRDSYLEIMSASWSEPRPEWLFVLVRKDIRYVKNEAAVRAAFDQFFGAPEPPTAIITMNDALAHYFMHEAASRGKSAPADFSIIGFDNVERHSPRPATLTTMHQPFDKMGRRAAKLLLERLANPDKNLEKRHILMSAPLLVRSTCRSLENAHADS